MILYTSLQLESKQASPNLLLGMKAQGHDVNFVNTNFVTLMNDVVGMIT